MPFSSGHLLVLAAMLIWGSVGIFVRLADQPATTIVFVRVATAFCLLGAYMFMRKQKINLGRHKQAALVSGVVISLNWLFFFKAIQTTTIGNAVLTYYFSPIFSILWARLFLGERLERRAAWALLLAAAGIGLMLSNYEFSLTSRDFLGIIYGLTGALFYSMVVVLVKGMSGVAANHIVFVQMGIASLMFLVQHASILSYVDPVSAIVYAFICFNEVPALLTIIGGVCILTASFLVISQPTTAAVQERQAVNE